MKLVTYYKSVPKVKFYKYSIETWVLNGGRFLEYLSNY